MIAAGIDAGSRTLKIVLLQTETLRVQAAGRVDQGIAQNALAADLLTRLLEENHVSRAEIGPVVATGYGRNLISIAADRLTEITCQAVGVRRVAPQARTIIDVGGQDSKCLRLNAAGAVADFALNDRCAAGTGRFLEMAAQRLNLDLQSFGGHASASTAPAAINSMCAVFAETEMVSLLAEGILPADLAAGIERAIALRIAALAGVGAAGPVVFTGGVALVPGMSQALAAALGQPVLVAPDPQMTCALGAALLAVRQCRPLPH